MLKNVRMIEQEIKQFVDENRSLEDFETKVGSVWEKLSQTDLGNKQERYMLTYEVTIWEYAAYAIRAAQGDEDRWEDIELDARYGGISQRRYKHLKEIRDTYRKRLDT